MTEAEGFTDMIEFLTKCSNEGLLDPDWAVNTSTTVCEKFAGGKAIIVQMNRNGLGTTVPAMLETLGIGYEDLNYVNALKGSDGTCKYMRTEAINFVTVVLRSSENAADAINWIDLKQQEQLFLNIGVEGTHFNYDENDGSILPINPIFSDERGNSYWYLDSTNEEEFSTQWPARIRKSQAQWEGFEATTLYANEHMPEIFVNNDFAFKPATELGVSIYGLPRACMVSHRCWSVQSHKIFGLLSILISLFRFRKHCPKGYQAKPGGFLRTCPPSTFFSQSNFRPLSVSVNSLGAVRALAVFSCKSWYTKPVVLRGLHPRLPPPSRTVQQPE